MTDLKKILREAIDKVGSQSKMAEAVGISQAGVSQWRRVPIDHIAKVSKITGIPKEKLRPDLKALFK
jgi:DNA-binding transcriptional regulator YdaS (Cro superfamily)|tara:strand:+ start:779 stop:979 length:201 start_codon:yes stop_codon:yes gene_type:complete